MKTRLHIFIMIFFLFSQTADANGNDSVNLSTVAQTYIIPIISTAGFVFIVQKLPDRFNSWKVPLQAGFAVFISQFFWSTKVKQAEDNE